MIDKKVNLMTMMMTLFRVQRKKNKLEKEISKVNNHPLRRKIILLKKQNIN